MLIWGIKNSQFDEPAISIYRRFEAPCSIAVPVNNIGSKHRAAWRPRDKQRTAFEGA